MMRLSNDEEFRRYFTSPEFKQTLHAYEAMQESGKPTYFDADQLTDIAEFYAARGDHDKAEAAIDHALLLHPGSTDPMVFKARNLLAHDEIESAYKLCRTIPDQKDFEVRLLYAEIHLTKNQPDKADKVLMDYVNTQEEDPDHMCEIMRDCSEVFSDFKHYEYSLKWGYTLLEHVKTNANKPENILYAEEVILVALRDLNRYDEALALSNDMLDRDPYYIAAWIIQSEIYIAQKMYNEAIEAADYAIAIDDTNMGAVVCKANSFFFLENMTEALKLYRKCIQYEFHPDVCHYMCGLIEASRRNHMQALNDFLVSYKTVGDTANFSFELCYNMALNFAAIGRKEEALFFYEQAEDIEPGNESLDELMDYINELPDEEHDIDGPLLT